VNLTIDQLTLNKLLGAANGDAALLYLYLHSGAELSAAPGALHMSPGRVSCAEAALRQLGLWQSADKPRIPMGEPPVYSETDVLHAKKGNPQFHALCADVERTFGRVLTTEELKILLSFINYLGLSPEVISLLVGYCKNRARQQGRTRLPSLRTIEKEAYLWADRGIDTMQEASAFIQAQDARYSQLGQLMRTLQIHNRQLTAAESRYAAQWLDWGFDQSALALAYERSCLNTGGLNWAYMNKILARWQAAGLLTAAQVHSGDAAKPGSKPQPGQRQLDADEQAAIARMLQEV